MKLKTALVTLALIAGASGLAIADELGGPVDGFLTIDPQTAMPAVDGNPVVPAQAAKDPIDIAEQECLKSPEGGSAAGMLYCMTQSHDRWDAKLNKDYRALRKQPSPSAKAALKQAQRAWLRYRDADKAYQAAYEPAAVGSLGKVELMRITLNVLRARALTLQNYLSLYAEADEVAIDDRNTPLDTAYDACVEKDPTTAGMALCAEQAGGDWDAKMNQTYRQLLKDPKTKDPLRAAQRTWVAFRNAEYKAIDGLYGGLEGTMYIPMKAYAKANVIRQRAMILTQYASETGVAAKRP